MMRWFDNGYGPGSMPGHGSMSGWMSGWAWVPWTVGLILLVAVLAAATVLIARSLRRPAAAGPGTGVRPTPEQVLAERFARGDIDEQEYRTRLDILGGRSGTS